MAVVNNTDKGWSWVVMASSFGIHVIHGFFLNGMGVIQVALLEQFGEAVWKTSWTTSLLSGCLLLYGPLAGYAINRWSCRVALILGSLLMTAGLVTAAFVSSLNYAIISIGVISGLGAGLTGATSEVVIAFNFVRYRNLACGIGVSGVGIGTLILTPLMQIAEDSYGYSGLCLMSGALSLHLAIFGALSRPSYLEIKSKERLKEGQAKKALTEFVQSFGLLKKCSFACLCLSMTAFTLGVYAMNVHFTSLVLQQGTTKYDAVYFLSLSGACNAVSRILVGVASNSDNINELLLYSGSFSILGLTAIFIPLYINYFAGQIAFAVFLGTYSGSCFTLLNSITVKLVGIENLAMAYGIEMFAAGTGGVIGPVIFGMFVDAGLTYAQTFIIAGALALLGGMFGWSVSCTDKGRASRVDGSGNETEQRIDNQETEKSLDMNSINETNAITDGDVSTYI